MATPKNSPPIGLIVFISILTFPFWIGIAGRMFGMIMGSIGTIIGTFVDVVVSFAEFAALPFKILFGIGDSIDFSFNGYLFLAFAIVAFLLVKGDKKQTQ